MNVVPVSNYPGTLGFETEERRLPVGIASKYTFDMRS